MKVVRYKMLGLNDSLDHQVSAIYGSKKSCGITLMESCWFRSFPKVGPALRGAEPKSWPGSIKARVQPYQP